MPDTRIPDPEDADKDPVEADKPAQDGTEQAKSGRNPALIAGALVILTAALILTWMSISDRYAPYTSRGLVASNISQLAPRVSGRLENLMVETNSIVKAGDVLFTIDKREYEIALDKAKTNLEQASQSVTANTTNLAAAQAQVADARSQLENAQEQYARTKALNDRGYATKARLDQDTAARDSAQAALNAAIARSTAAREQLGATDEENVQIRAAALAVEQANYDLNSTTVKAPRDGVITNLHVAPGQYIGAGSPLMTFIETEIMWVSANFRENQLGNMKPGDKATILFDAIPGMIFHGSVDSIAWGINPQYRESNGLPISSPPNQWFEPARRIPVRIFLDGGPEAWPPLARVGGKVEAVVYTTGIASPVGIISGFLQRMMSYLTIFY